jgi:hypothetical protein
MSDHVPSCFISTFVCYITTETTFIKRELAAREQKIREDGTTITRPWVKERLENEASALLLIREKTTIPVPKLIGVGRNADGLAYLETERLSGIKLEEIEDECRMQRENRHVEEGVCETCGSIAKENAQIFIEKKVLPQLEKLKSTTTGLNGFVLPPPWILENDTRENWKPMTTDSASYIFCHGDLAAHNIMVDPETLQVVGLFDWEHAGYFPQEFQVWSVDRQDYWNYFRSTERVKELVALINID